VSRAGWTAGLAAVAGLGLLLRLERALALEPSYTEAVVIGIAERVFDPAQPWPRHGGDHPFLGVYLMAASAWAFGRDLLGYRLLGVLAGAASPALAAWALAPALGRPAAFWAALLLAVNPFHVGVSSEAFEIVHEIAFVTGACGLVLRRRPGALVGCAVLLGLAFLCKESAALVALVWAVLLWRRPELRAGRRRGELGLAAAAGLLVIAPDVLYNLTATAPDYEYVNYLDHLERIARPALSLQGLGFFLRDAFGVLLADRFPGAWQDVRCEMPGPGIVLGVLLLAGWLHAFRRDGDPTGGLLRWTPAAFVAVASFTQPLHATPLDPPTWTWPAPALALASGALGLAIARHARLWPLWLLAFGLMSRPGPPGLTPCS
jgi:4-amino-4-deoxy-L-arabinose transferase-like glycosyltransferase